MAGEGDGEGVDWSFDEHRHGTLLNQLGDRSVGLGALVEQDGVGGVEVLRSAPVVIGGVGVAGDEPEDLVLVGDGRAAVAEAVDEVPVVARVASPVSRSSSSVTPRPPRWSTKDVHSAGAYPR